MPRPWSQSLAAVTIVLAVVLAGQRLGAQTDLDAFMKQVMERRDDNWKRLQQYILDEREEFDIRGPGGLPIWGEKNEFTWFIREGYFVRSPLKANGVAVGEDDRLRYEANYLRRAQNQDKRERAREQADAGSDSNSASASDQKTPGAPSGLDDFIQQTRQPEFISSAYFLRFKFDEGRYALVGREKLEGQEVLRVEYYPTKLFAEEPRDRRRQDREASREVRAVPNSPAVDDTVNRLMNRGSRVTLWIEQSSRQIVKYTFENVDLDFFPARWMASFEGLRASMTMAQPFPDVWLPSTTAFDGRLQFAIGEVSFRATVNYHDYRRAEVTTAIRVPGVR